jgi:hypothetical protein
MTAGTLLLVDRLTAYGLRVGKDAIAHRAGGLCLNEQRTGRDERGGQPRALPVKTSSPPEGREYTASVRCWPGDRVDDEHLQWSRCGVELEAELLLQRGEHRRTITRRVAER